MSVYSVRYRCTLIDEGLTVQVPTSDTTSVERTLDEGDIVFVYEDPPEGETGVYGDLYYVTDGEIVPTPVVDARPGDVIVSICPTTDVPSQSGTAIVICTDRTVTSLT